MAQNYTEQLRKDNVRDAIYEDLQNNCEVLRTSWSGNAFPANPKVGQPCYRVDEDKLYYWDGHKWSQKGGGGSAELKTMELAAATSERVSITLEGARCLDKNMMFVFVDKIAQDPSTYSMNDDGTVVNFNPAIPANAAVTLRWFDTDVGTFDTAIFASDAEFAAGELTNKAPNVKQVHSLSDQIQTSNANYVKSEFQSNLLNYTTNRILEIPQDIKLELNNGTLTLKAGSKLYYPDGFESDGTTPKFYEYIVQTDYSFTGGNYGFTGIHILTFSRKQSGIDAHTEPEVGMCYSGTTAPTDFGQYAYWWDLSINRFKWTRDSGSTWDLLGTSLPVALFHYDGTSISSIDQIFNGFGYIGSTVFVLPGVKVQIPNGRNEDGTYRVIPYTTQNAITMEVTGTGVKDILLYSNGTLNWATGGTYLSEDGYVHSNLNGITINCVIFAQALITSAGKIDSFVPRNVDSIVNSNASNFSQAGRSYLSGLGMPSGRYIDLTLGASGATYTAPANGWVYCAGKTTALPCYMSVDIPNTFCGINGFAADIDLTLNQIAVEAGTVFGIRYANATLTLLRFVYAQGDQ